MTKGLKSVTLKYSFFLSISGTLSWESNCIFEENLPMWYGQCPVWIIQIILVTQLIDMQPGRPAAQTSAYWRTLDQLRARNCKQKRSRKFDCEMWISTFSYIKVKGKFEVKELSKLTKQKPFKNRQHTFIWKCRSDIKAIYFFQDYICYHPGQSAAGQLLRCISVILIKSLRIVQGQGVSTPEEW